MTFVRWCFLAVLLGGVSSPAYAAGDKIMKVLPQYLDLQGRNSLSPSLYDRDAYQSRLRRRPEDRSGMQFQIQWKARTIEPLKLRLETRGTKGGETTAITLEAPVRHAAGFNKWTELTLKGDDYSKLGDLNAWRVSLWDGDKLLAEQKSFLW
ncbi:MAG: hypothetical protein JWM16_2228 [Verrucomicrobiales bacterium]|nr:hypothetical protein [Verrucomicrobiales bacterium]